MNALAKVLLCRICIAAISVGVAACGESDNGENCTPDCLGKECGEDGCGSVCGTCAGSWQCGDDQVCFSLPLVWTDPTSGLSWQVKPPSDYKKWDEAKSYCDSLSLERHSDWRLPTIGELRTLIRGCPATEFGGSCNIEKGDCLAKSCMDNSCTGCSIFFGPALEFGGMYWPDEVEGDYCTNWSSSPVEDDGGVWWINFSDARIRGGPGSWNEWHARCVR